MAECVSFTEFRGGWREVASYLGIDVKYQDDIETNNPKAGPFNIAQRLLTQWKRIKGENATIDVLVNALERTNFNDIAEALKNEFKRTIASDTRESSQVSNPDAENLARKQMRHINDNKKDLINLTNCTANVYAILLSKGILDQEQIDELVNKKTLNLKHE